MQPTLSIQLPCFSNSSRDWGPVIDLACVADDAGVDRIVVSDHILLGERLDAYAEPSTGGIKGGRQPTGPDGHWMEPLTLLTFVAARTARIRLGTAIVLAALRPAAVLAKQVATLDVLSAGRVDLGVGVGWQREEYEACGLDFRARGMLLDRTLDLCRRLWSDQVVDHSDGLGRFERVHAMPKPVQPGGVPIWVAGRATAKTAERVASFGDGWIPWGDDMAAPAAGVAVMRHALERVGRDPDDLRVTGMLRPVHRDGSFDADATMNPVGDLLAVGVTDFRLARRWLTDDKAEDEEVLRSATAAFWKATGRRAG